MSLIIDALKRAAQKPASLPSAAGLQPAEERPHHFPVAPLIIVLIPIIGIGLWFLAKGLRMRDRAEPKPVAARAPEPFPVPTRVVVVQVTNVPTPAREPAYKLQGIYWRPSKPSAAVNGKVVYVGDRFKNARVIAIDQDSVTLKVDGQTNPLVLP
ncbi:MAG TPA: hypothetical protein VK850_11860 [Candidatus Binatia bacterium]|nr:hypothetical protein [Candidatus Binatia bacterium]